MPRVEIQICGHLDPSWSERLGGLSISHISDGTTTLAGFIQDQSALHGLFAILGNLNLTLISVTTMPAASARQEGGEDKGSTALFHDPK